MIRALDVALHGIPIGRIIDEGGVRFEIDPAYWLHPHRSVLGQWFEDRPDEVWHEGPGPLPAFFANLEPEGALANWLARRYDLSAGPLDLLARSGHALVGAVTLGVAGESREAWRWGDLRAGDVGAVPGVQFKLPMSLDKEDRLVFPAEDAVASVLVKWSPRDVYRQIAVNEHACLTWARFAGFAVPDCWLQAPPLDAPEGFGGPALVVERFDRPVGAPPVHQEDFCQVLGLDPEQKYPLDPAERRAWPADAALRQVKATTVEGLGRVVRAVLGDAGFVEYLRRTVFVVASGNGDAHLKNWSIRYPDRRTPVWAPLYDQVSTIAWNVPTLALPFYGVVSWAGVHRSMLHRLGDEVSGMTVSAIDAVIDDTLGALAAAWGAANEVAPWPEHHRGLLVHHWRSTVPLLRTCGRDPFGPG